MIQSLRDWGISLVVSVVAGWLVWRAVQPRRLTGHDVIRISSGVSPAGAELANRGLFASPLYTDLASRESLSRTILGISRASTTWLPVTGTGYMFADSWDFKDNRARLKTGLNLQCVPLTWPKHMSLEMRIFSDEYGQDQNLLAWIPMGRVWVWPWRRFRIEPGAVHVDIEPSLPQKPINLQVDSKGKVIIPSGALSIEVEVKE